MERQIDARVRQNPQTESPLPDANLEANRSKLEALLQEADNILDAIPPAEAEDYLQQSRQRGAQ